MLLIVNWVGASQQRFDQLFHLFLTGEYRVVQRAAWAVSNCVIANPSFIKKHWKLLLDNVAGPDRHAAVKRNTMRLLQQITIPKKYQGLVVDICFGNIESASEPLAIKSYALAILQNLARRYPELLPEIKLMIQDRMPYESAAFRSRAKKILNSKNS